MSGSAWLVWLLVVLWGSQGGEEYWQTWKQLYRPFISVFFYIVFIASLLLQTIIKIKYGAMQELKKWLKKKKTVVEIPVCGTTGQLVCVQLACRLEFLYLSGMG